VPQDSCLKVTAVSYILGKAVPARAMKAYGGHGTIAPHLLNDIQKQCQRTAIQKPLFCYAYYKTLKKTQQDRHLERNRKNPKQNKNKKSDIPRLCLDYVMYASFIGLKRLNVKILQ